MAMKSTFSLEFNDDFHFKYGKKQQQKVLFIYIKFIDFQEERCVPDRSSVCA